MSTWYETHRSPIFPRMCDQYGHVNVRFYAHLFDDASFALWPMVGLGPDTFANAAVHTVVARTETDFIEEIIAGRIVAVRTRIARIGTKSVSIEQELYDIERTSLHAKQTAVEVFFDPKTRSAVPIPAPLRKLLEDAR